MTHTPANVTNLVVTGVWGGAVLKRERGAGAGPELRQRGSPGLGGLRSGIGSGARGREGARARGGGA